MLLVLVLTLAVAVSPLVPGARAATDWSMFRGPNASGISNETGLPVEFGPGKNMVWKTELPPGHSSPVFGKDSIFLTGFEKGSLFTFALDRESGKIRWRREIKQTRAGELQEANSPTSPSPVTDGENVYVMFQDAGLFSYGPDGNERWRIPLGPFNNPMGMGTSPILANGKIIQVCDSESGSFMIAVDKDTGKIVWRNERPFVARGFSTPLLYDPKDGSGLQVLVAGSFQLTAYSVETGEKIWWVRGLTWQVKPTPVMDEDTIYIQNWAGNADLGKQEDVVSLEEALKTLDKNGDGAISPEEAPDPSMAKSWDAHDLDRDGVLREREWEFYRRRKSAVNAVQAIRLGGKGDMTEGAFRWRHYKTLPNVPSPLLYQNVLYMMKEGGILTAFNPKTGEILKQGRLRDALGRYFSAPVAADNKIFVTSEEGKLTVLKPGADWEVLRTNDMGDPCYATPAIIDGKIYVRTTTALYCFEKGG